MAKYEVTSINSLREYANSLNFRTKFLDYNVTSLDTLLGEIKEYWLQEEPDAIKYVEALTNTISDLKKMVTCFDKFSGSMVLYADALKQTSSKSAD